MVQVRFSGNVLFFDDKEVRDVGCQQEVPAHYQAINCIGVSPGEKLVI